MFLKKPLTSNIMKTIHRKLLLSCLPEVKPDTESPGQEVEEIRIVQLQRSSEGIPPSRNVARDDGKVAVKVAALVPREQELGLCAGLGQLALLALGAGVDPVDGDVAAEVEAVDGAAEPGRLEDEELHPVAAAVGDVEAGRVRGGREGQVVGVGALELGVVLRQAFVTAVVTKKEKKKNTVQECRNKTYTAGRY